MPGEVTILLYDDQSSARTAIEIKGSSPPTGTDINLENVVITAAGKPQSYSVTGGAVRIPAKYVTGTDPKAMQFQRGDVPLTVSARLTFQAETPGGTTPAPGPGPAPAPPVSVPFLGTNFSVRTTGVGFELSLRLNLPGPAGTSTPEPPLATLTCRGLVELAPGSSTFASAAIGFRVGVVSLPVSFPSKTTPRLEVILPGDLSWPEIQVPWPQFPNLPQLTNASKLRLPAFTVPLDPLPVRLGWKAIDLSVDTAGGLVVSLIGLNLSRVSDNTGAIAGNLDFVFTRDGVTLVPAIKALNGVTSPAFKSFDRGGFDLDWGGSPVGPFLGLVSQELSDEISSASASSNRLKLRVRGAGAQLDEVRLDWTSTVPRDFALPGFSVSFPNATMLSLVGLRGDEESPDDGPRLMLVGTIPPPPTSGPTPPKPIISLHSPFSWPLSEGEREILRDGRNSPSDKVISLDVQINKPLSIVFCDLPLGAGAPPRYLRMLGTPLVTISEGDGDAGTLVDGEYVLSQIESSGDASTKATPFSKDSISIPSQSLSADFLLPFLNHGLAGLLSQGLRITHIDVQVDPETLAITCVVSIEVTIIDGAKVDTAVTLGYDLERMAFKVDHDRGLWLTMKSPGAISILGLNCTITPAPGRLFPGPSRKITSVVWSSRTLCSS